jgi:2-polyprenyl-3-methyl-5-hydroxy-6-metoxy-1,4-benzoquinol methylase
MDTLMAYQRSSCLKAAIDLDIFTTIAKGSNSVQGIADASGASERGIRSLCDFLTINGFLTKEGSQYGLAPTSAAFLNKLSPAYIGSIAQFLGSPDLLKHFSDMANVVKRGGTADNGTIETESDVWVDFAKGMAPMMAMIAEPAATHLVNGSEGEFKVLDIAAGHGLYGIFVAKRSPNAKIVGLDWAKVLAVAKENAAKAGVADRYSTIEGDAFKVDFGSDYDLILIPNFLHHFDAETNIGFLKKVGQALKPGGRVATIEFVPNEDRVSPPMPASFTITMLAGTPSGDCYTFTELSDMFSKAGFSSTERIDLPPTPQTLLISKV